LTGRIKDEINRAGFKVQPAEIDMVIEAHPAVAEACVFGIPDPVSGEIVGAAVRLKEGAAAESAAIQRWCRGRLRREAVPERWFMVDAIPRSARGKVNRDAVRRQLAETVTAAGSSHSAPISAPPDSPALPGSWPAPGRVRAAVECAWTLVLGRP